ncbi:MAG: OadG family protein [Methylococcales bacterium]|nr:OadG family protein [Methylococcales bacterium]
MNELLSSGMELMLIGMGIVFGFLALLVLSIGCMSSLVQRFFPEISGSHLAAGQHDDPGIVAAITAAVQQYRKKHQKN